MGTGAGASQEQAQANQDGQGQYVFVHCPLRRKMYYCTSNDFEKRQDYFVCSSSRKLVDACPESHYIRAEVLEEMVLMHIQYAVSYVQLYEDSFRATLGATRTKEIQQQLSAKRRKAAQAKKRDEELNLLFQRVYEDHVAGKVTEERFLQLSNGYDTEQRELRELIARLEIEIDQQEQQTTQVEEFISKCKRYSELDELTPTILNDLVSKVFVEVPDKSTGKRRQGIRVSYALVGILPPLERFKPLVVERSNKKGKNGVALRHAVSVPILLYLGPPVGGDFFISKS